MDSKAIENQKYYFIERGPADVMLGRLMEISTSKPEYSTNIEALLCQFIHYLPRAWRLVAMILKILQFLSFPYSEHDLVIVG